MAIDDNFSRRLNILLAAVTEHDTKKAHRAADYILGYLSMEPSVDPLGHEAIRNFAEAVTKGYNKLGTCPGGGSYTARQNHQFITQHAD